MTERCRLVHVTTTDISLALLLGPQLQAFGDAGYDVIGASAPGPWVPRLPALGVAHQPLVHSTRSWAPVEDLRALVELWRLFRRLRPDIVHTHNPKPGVYGRIAARLAGVPVVVNTVHGLYAQPVDRWARRLPVYALERLAATCSDVELVQGPEDLATLASIGVPRRKLVHLGNGIDLTRFDATTVSPAERDAVRAAMGAADGDIVCGVVARLVREKGIDEMLAAARLLRSSAPGVRVVVIGIAEPGKADGYEPAQLEAMAEDAGVVLLGARDDMPACYAAMDLLAFPSRREGFPRVPMEAAAMGVPVVAADVRGTREAVEHERTGVLVPVGDAAALADAIAGLAGDAGRRARMGAAARAKAAATFDDRRVVAVTLGAYRRALARRGRTAPQPPVAPGSVVVRLATDADAAAVAALHQDLIDGGFLGVLGPRFLRRLYRRLVRWHGSFVVVATIDGCVVGMSGATTSVRRLYRAFAVRDGVVAAAAAAPTVARSWRRVIETLRYGVVDHPGLPEAELLSLAVAPAGRGRGLGAALAREVVDELTRRGAAGGVRVAVGADNLPAQRAYATAGFEPASTVEVHAGTAQQVLVCR